MTTEKTPAPSPRKAPKQAPKPLKQAPKQKISPEARARQSLAPSKKLLKKRLKTKPAEKKDPKKELPTDITKEKIKIAKKYIEQAKNTLQQKDPYKTALKKHGINLKSASYYLSFAIKESRASASAKSSAGAVGYFQITPFATAGIKEAFDINLSPQALKDPIKNAIAGILYFHYCRDFYSKRWKVECDQKELMAALMYNAGPTIYRSIYRALKGQKSYREIEKYLASELISQLPSLFKAKTDKEYSNGYRVYYHSDFEITGKIKGKHILIDGKSYSAIRIVQALHYTRIVESIRNSKKYSV
ncbi:MAG: transglycosylase SLT domain-containing protein [Candidatus Peregrinibacteria bacterium]|nr:transglycosylase SLT domain-containing protein [Candidatus Peregrinibacteria bacterium]